MKETSLVSESNVVCPFHSGIDAKIEAHYKEVDLQITAVCLKMDERKEQVNIKFDAINKEITLAKEDMERRLSEMNQFRAQLSAQAGTFATRHELKVEAEKLDLKLGPLLNQANFRSGSKHWSDHILTVLIATAVMLFVHFVFKF
jgi:hypothetical protein